MDITLFSREQGTGLPLLLLHGNGEDGTYFVHQMAFFSRFYRVIALDTRGHGQSPRGDSPFTIRQFAADLLDFMDEMGLKKAHILGFSDGGNIALTFALAHPERVDHLILNGANLFPAGVKPTVQLPIVLGYHMASLFRNEKARHNAELLGLMVKEPNFSPADLAGLHVPTLVIAGTKDMILERHTRLIADSLPDARLALLPGDHFIANKQPEAFNQAVLDFLQGGLQDA